MANRNVVGAGREIPGSAIRTSKYRARTIILPRAWEAAGNGGARLPKRKFPVKRREMCGESRKLLKNPTPDREIFS